MKDGVRSGFLGCNTWVGWGDGWQHADYREWCMYDTCLVSRSNHNSFGFTPPPPLMGWEGVEFAKYCTRPSNESRELVPFAVEALSDVA